MKFPPTVRLPFSPQPAKIPGLQAPRQLESLDDLLQQAAHYAEFCMRNSGRMPPTLFLIGVHGPVMFMPESLANTDQKDTFATISRLMSIAHGATHSVMALEAWLKVAPADEPLDMTEPPSEAFDRKEAVVLMGESRTSQKQKYLPIIRSGNGKFFGFGESDLPEFDQIEGRFAGILPPNPPTEEHRAIAQAMLQAKGVRFETPDARARRK